MYESLGAAVIFQAVEDLVLDKPRNCRSRNGQREAAKASAREFLLAENEDLKFWCRISGLDWKVVVERSNQVADGKLKISLVRIYE